MALPVPDRPHVIIAGFGVPGRFIAEALEFHGVPFCVIETNSAVAERCTTVPMVVGDVRDEAILRAAGIERATLLALAIPIDEVVLQTVELTRRIRPDLKIIARVNYTSAGLAAQKLGANDVIVGEQIVAREFFRFIQKELNQ